MGRLVVRLKAIKYNEDFFCYLFSLTIYPVELSSHMPSGRIIRLSFFNAVLSFVMPSGFSGSFIQWVISLSFAITLMLWALPKPWIQDLSQQLNRASFLLSLSLVASNSECLRAIWMRLASLVKESNRHQRAILCYIQYTVHLGLITEVLIAQCLWKRVTFSTQAPF